MGSTTLWGGPGIISKGEKEVSKGGFQGILRRLWRASGTRLYVGGLESFQKALQEALKGNCISAEMGTSENWRSQTL